MTPNIDEQGAQARQIGSWVALFLSAVFLMLPGLSRVLSLAVFAILLALGLLMRFQAKKRWCALRACGIKTPL